MSQALQTQEKSEAIIILDKIKSGLEAFEERKQTLSDLVKDSIDLKLESVDDKQTLNSVVTARKALKVARVDVQKEGKLMRDPLTQLGKQIKAKEDELVAIIEPEEERLEGIEKWVKEEKEKQEAEEARKAEERVQKRIDRLAEYGYAIDLTFLKAIDDEQFEKVVVTAKTQFDQDQAAAAEKSRQEQAQREQDERDRAELKALREKQEAADKILRDREEEIARKEAELKRQEEEKAEKKRREDEMKERERVREIFSSRLPQLKEWSSNGHYVYAKGGQWGIVTDIVDMPEDKFIELVKENNAYIRDRDAEKERIRLEEIEEAKAKAIKEEKERESESRRQEEERLAQASDKEKFAVIVSYLEGLPSPEMKSAKHKKLLAEVKELNAKIIAHIKAKS